MSDAAQPTLEYFSETVSPGVPAGTMIAEISLRPSRSPVTAVTVMRSVIAVPELVMKLFAPLITHSPPSRRAVVRGGSGVGATAGLGEPECAERLPRRRAGGASASSAPRVPKRAIGMAPSETAASRVIATDESTRASSSSATQSAK